MSRIASYFGPKLESYGRQLRHSLDPRYLARIDLMRRIGGRWLGLVARARCPATCSSTPVLEFGGCRPTTCSAHGFAVRLGSCSFVPTGAQTTDFVCRLAPARGARCQPIPSGANRLGSKKR